MVLLDVLAERASTKALWVIVTTHSPTIVSSVPAEHVRLVFRDASHVRVIATPSEGELAISLGMPPRFEGAILVEDRAAKAFALELMRRKMFDAIDQFEVCETGGESELKEALKRFPRVGKWLNIVGLFDGDMRSANDEISKSLTAKSWGFCYLPGDFAPEIELRNAVADNGKRLSELLSIDEKRTTLSLTALEGADHHDWLVALSGSLGCEYHSLVSALVDIWLDVDENAQKADEACALLEKKLWPKSESNGATPIK